MEDTQEPAIVASGPVVVSADSSGVSGRWGQSDDAGKPVGGLEYGEVPAGGTEEFGGEDWAEAWHAQQHLGVLVFGDFVTDQCIECGEFLVQGEYFLAECGDDSLSDMLCGNDGVLGFRSLDCR